MVTVRGSKHLFNVVFGQFNTVVQMGAALLLTPAVLRGLGDSAYGGWLLINSFIGYMKFLDLGSTAGTVKFAAGAQERGDRRDLAAALDTSWALSLGLAGIAALVTLVLAVILPWLYPTIATNQLAVILMLGGAMIVELIFRPFVATLRMRSLFFVYDAIELTTFLTLTFGLVFYLAYTGALTYRALALVTLGETVVRLVLVLLAAVVVSPAARHINPFHARRSMVRKIAGFGIAVFIMMVADVVRFQLDAGVIGFFMPDSPESITIFGMGSRLLGNASSAIVIMGGVLVPRFSGLWETGNRSGIDKLLKRSSLFTGLACSLVLVNLAVLGPQFLGLWLRKPWTPQSGTILLILLPAYWIGLLSAPSKSLLLGAGRVRGLTMFICAEAVANLALSVLLIRPFGIIGVALGTAVPLALFHGVLLPLLLRRDLDMSPKVYWRIQLPALAVGGVYLLLIGALAVVPVPTFARFLLLGSGTTVVFAILTLAMLPDVRVEMGERVPFLGRLGFARS